MKKRLTAITLALAMTLGLTACGNTSGQNQQPAGESGQPASDEPIVLRFADTDSADSVAGQGGQMFCDLVEERTDGRVVVEYYPASQLGGDKAITEAAIAGTVDIAKCSNGNFVQFSDALEWVDLPGVLSSVEQVRKLFTSEYRDEVNAQILEDTGGIALMFDVDAGEPRAIGSTKKEIRVPADMNGVKVRSTGSEIELALFNNWGASSTSLDWGEVYTAMQQNLVETTYNQVQTLEINSFGEILNYITPINQSWVVSAKFIGPKAIEKLGGLDSELFQIVQECALECEVWKDKAFVEANAESYEKLKEQGAKQLIVDLRNNPGGLMTAVCDVLREILPEGLIVYTEDKYGNRVEETCDGKSPLNMPLVVLVNEGSASASEIFAGAVQDHKVGTIVGTTTYGKGIVQTVRQLSEADSI